MGENFFPIMSKTGMIFLMALSIGCSIEVEENMRKSGGQMEESVLDLTRKGSKRNKHHRRAKRVDKNEETGNTRTIRTRVNSNNGTKKTTVVKRDSEGTITDTSSNTTKVATSCWVYVSYCNNPDGATYDQHDYNTGWIYDNYLGASSSAAQCIKRASDFAYWCAADENGAIDPNFVAYADFYLGSTLEARGTFSGGHYSPYNR